MPTYAACLLDVFDTILTVDQERHLALLAERGGVDADRIAATAKAWTERVNEGRATLADAIGPELAELDREIQLELAVVPPDTEPFLRALRDAGVRTALVSNCNENARPLLEERGLVALVDEVVLSCEVGAAKPDPAIFRMALDRLEVPPAGAVFVDDLDRYCVAAADLGMRVVRIDRSGGGDVATLAELTPRIVPAT